MGFDIHRNIFLYADGINKFFLKSDKYEAWSTIPIIPYIFLTEQKKIIKFNFSGGKSHLSHWFAAVKKRLPLPSMYKILHNSFEIIILNREYSPLARSANLALVKTTTTNFQAGM